MSSPHVRSFDSPDELIEMETLRSRLVTMAGLTISHDVHRPDWRWSVHVKPLVGGESCQVRHVGVVLAGRVHIRLDDGEEFEAGPLDLVDVPVGHDAWVVGDERLEMIAWTGATGWLGPLESLRERVLATLVLTDIVDSTGTALRLGDRRWSDTLASYEALVRDILSRFRGREIKMTGDGVLAAFDGAARAVRCAVSLVAAASNSGLEMRAAVHTGEVEIVETDIHGLAVNELSRMLGLAGSGEVIASATTEAFARDSGFEFEDHGHHELRGIDGTRQVFLVRQQPV